MKYLTILSLFFVMFIGSLSAQTIKMDSEEVDLGLVSRRSFMSHTFKITNTGDAPLVITKLESPSEFVLAWAPLKPIEPGQSAALEVMYDAVNLGIFNDVLYIISNNKAGRVTLKIKGEVR